MELNSQRLIFVPLAPGHFENYKKLVCCEEVMKLITGRALTEQEAQERFQKNLAVNKAHPDIGWYLIFTREENTFVGLGKLVMIGDHEAEIGYSLLPEHWGKSYASEISARLIQHARTKPDIHMLIAIIDPANAASKRILVKGYFSLAEVCDLDGLPAEIYKLSIA